jgi:hypothetical protein
MYEYVLIQQPAFGTLERDQHNPAPNLTGLIRLEHCLEQRFLDLALLARLLTLVLLTLPRLLLWPSLVILARLVPSFVVVLGLRRSASLSDSVWS